MVYQWLLVGAWALVYLPLWKMIRSQLGWLFHSIPNQMESHKFMFQATKQYPYRSMATKEPYLVTTGRTKQYHMNHIW